MIITYSMFVFQLFNSTSTYFFFVIPFHINKTKPVREHCWVSHWRSCARKAETGESEKFSCTWLIRSQSFVLGTFLWDFSASYSHPLNLERWRDMSVYREQMLSFSSLQVQVSYFEKTPQMCHEFKRRMKETFVSVFLGWNNHIKQKIWCHAFIWPYLIVVFFISSLLNCF